MLLRETIRKSKILLNKTLINFRCFIIGGYQKLPRSFSFNPFLARRGNARRYTSDKFYNEFYDILQSDLNRINRNGEISSLRRSREEEAGDSSAATKRHHVSFAKQSTEKIIRADAVKEKKYKGNSQLLNSKKKNEGVHGLAQKMKELEMMESGDDFEHVLDIEEALHYYSRLTSPVYLDIVDKFFTDMHSDYTLPQSSVGTKHSKSKGRFASIRCG